MVEFLGGSGQKRGMNMNAATQSFGYGLAALLFCVAILGVCHNIKKAAFDQSVLNSLLIKA